MNDTVTVVVKVYGIDAADRHAYRTLREFGYTRDEANVVAALAVVAGAASPDSYVEVIVDGERYEGDKATVVAMRFVLDHVTGNPGLTAKAEAFNAWVP